MRAILGSYDSELTQAEYSPQLTQRMWEAEDMVQKVHAHSSEMEVGVCHGHVGTVLCVCVCVWLFWYVHYFTSYIALGG